MTRLCYETQERDSMTLTSSRQHDPDVEISHWEERQRGTPTQKQTKHLPKKRTEKRCSIARAARGNDEETEHEDETRHYFGHPKTERQTTKLRLGDLTSSDRAARRFPVFQVPDLFTRAKSRKSDSARNRAMVSAQSFCSSVSSRSRDRPCQCIHSPPQSTLSASFALSPRRRRQQKRYPRGKS